MEKGKNYGIVLANSVTSDGAEDFDLFKHGQAHGGPTDTGTNLIDEYDYVMHGKIFEDKISENNEDL